MVHDAATADKPSDGESTFTRAGSKATAPSYAIGDAATADKPSDGESTFTRAGSKAIAPSSAINDAATTDKSSDGGTEASVPSPATLWDLNNLAQHHTVMIS